MNRFKHLILLCLLFFAMAGPVTAEPWIGGFSLGNFGWNSGEILGEGGQISLFIDPLQWNTLNPSFYLDLSVPVFPFVPEEVSWGGRFFLSLFTWKDHPLGGFIGQVNWYSPAMAAGIEGPLNFGSPRMYLLEIHPFRIRTGDGVYSFFAGVAVFDDGLNLEKRGIRPFQFSYFMY